MSPVKPSLHLRDLRLVLVASLPETHEITAQRALLEISLIRLCIFACSLATGIRLAIVVASRAPAINASSNHVMAGTHANLGFICRAGQSRVSRHCGMHPIVRRSTGHPQTPLSRRETAAVTSRDQNFSAPRTRPGTWIFELTMWGFLFLARFPCATACTLSVQHYLSTPFPMISNRLDAV